MTNITQVFNQVYVPTQALLFIRIAKKKATKYLLNRMISIK